MYNMYGQQAAYGQPQQQPQFSMQQQQTGYQPQQNMSGQPYGYATQVPSQGTGYGIGSQQPYQPGFSQGMQPQATGYNSPQQQNPNQNQQYMDYQRQQQFGTPNQTNFPSQSSVGQANVYNLEAPMTVNHLQQQRTGFGQVNVVNSPQQFGMGPAGSLFGQQQQQQQQPFVPQQSAVSAAPSAPKLKRQKTGANIPSTRLSFVLAADQQKFETLFAKAVGPYNTALPGDEAKTILMKSGLSANQLSKIWALCDTNRSGQLLFPEFVLAMHLCNQAIRKGQLPDRLEEKVKNEVTSMVDQIAFAAAETSAAPNMQFNANVPNFNVTQQPQQMSNVSLMAQQMRPADMGFYNAQMLQAQMTGYQQLQPQQTGFQQMPMQQTGYQQMQPQQTGFQQTPMQQTGYQQLQAQQTGYQQVQPQRTGYQQMQPQQTSHQYSQGLQPGLTGIQQPGLTGMGSLQPQQSQWSNAESQFPMQALASQPTGRPGEWGFVHAPQGSVQGMQALGAAMMPGASSNQSAFQVPVQQQRRDVPWAITKEEKAIYDTIFQAWDKKGQGFVDGPVAIEVFGSSGVGRQDLEVIWALADADDKGKLNTDEFAVALHLIYRKLNGYEVPHVLPPELIPPSTRNFGDSISQVKTMLQQDASARQGPTSYMKSRSFKEGNTNRDYSKDGTVYKHDDADVGYVSSSRRRAFEKPSESPQASQSPARAPEAQKQEPSISDLKKLIKEKQVLLDAIDQNDQGLRDDDAQLVANARNESDDLIRQIRKVQAKLDAHQNAHLLQDDGDREKNVLQKRLQLLVDKLPQIASKVQNVERRIQDAQFTIWSKQDQKDNPGSASIVGTGVGGLVTEADKRRAKTKAMMAARTAALTGKQLPKSNEDDFEASAQRQAAKNSDLNKVRESNEQMIHDIQDSAETLRADIEAALGSSRASASSEHERRRWNDAVGVEPEVRDLIRELRSTGNDQTMRQSHSSAKTDVGVFTTTTAPSTSAVTTTTSNSVNRSATPTYNNFSTSEDRAAYLKQAAEARMAERLAALGIRPSKKAPREAVGTSSEQVIAAADSQTREQVLRDEQELQVQERLKVEEATQKAEAAVAAAQQKQEEELKRIASTSTATDVPRKDVTAQEKAARQPLDNRQEKLARLRAEREARLVEEQRLERELAENESSSDSETAASPPVVKSNPFSRDPVPADNSIQSKPSAPVPISHPVPDHSREDKSIGTTEASHNPFHKLSTLPPNAQSTTVSVARPPSAAPLTVQRTNAPRTKPNRKNSDDWSVASKEDDSSSDEEGPSPADLAARLFSGGMLPQRTGGAQTPLAAQRTGAASSPAPTSASPFPQHAASIPPPPPVGVSFPPPPPPLPSTPMAPSLPPPSNPGVSAHSATMPGLPPPPPPMGGPPPPPPPAMITTAASGPQDRNALLSSIKAGKGLKRVQTVEKGGATGGRVL